MKRNRDDKKIYIVLSHTGTLLSRVIRLFTKYEYSHVSISSDSNLDEMYSFGRIHPYVPFIGGFVHEIPGKGTFKRFKNTTSEIYSMTISKEQFETLKSTLRQMDSRKHEYHYNALGLCAFLFHKKLNRKNHFYCAEFVQYVLDTSKVETNLPTPCKPSDFLELKDIKLEYKGKLIDFTPKSA